jgi:ribulose-5-phosphate 4-epimerase/fuculose-1-phosphate aldolase
MIMNKELQEYLLLCKLFGAPLDFVQGTGGNISVKKQNTLYIKQSGFQLSDTKENEGYVLCDLDKITKRFYEKNQEIKDTVLQGNGQPSMETFFHLLPFDYIVHIHPTFLLNLLCQDTLAQLQNLFPQALCIPYVEPGIELAEVIHNTYSGQQLIFLQNHGVIFLERDIDSLVGLAYTVFSKLERIVPSAKKSDLAFIYEFYKQKPSGYMKPSYLIPKEFDIFSVKSYTPDYHLFLKNASVVKHNDLYYVLGNSKAHVENSEQMCASYALCMFDAQSQEIPTDATVTLETNPLEKERLSVFKDTN